MTWAEMFWWLVGFSVLLGIARVLSRLAGDKIARRLSDDEDTIDNDDGYDSR